MTVLITGGTGFIGKQLIKQLVGQGYFVRVLSRSPYRDKELSEICELAYWDAESIPEKEVFFNVEIIINLVGENVAAKKWSTKQKERIYDSRVYATSVLVQGAKLYADKLHTFISGSAVGFYNQKSNILMSEHELPGSDFLSKVCKDWEEAAQGILEKNNVRECRIRTGLVLGKGGGALARMKGPFKFGIGGVLGSGKQWMNWIHRTDLCNMILFLIKNREYSGAFNAVAPNNCTNKVFTKTLGKVLWRPTVFWVPSFMLKLIFGQMASILLYGSRCSSQRIEGTGFQFKYPDLEYALKASL